MSLREEVPADSAPERTSAAARRFALPDGRVDVVSLDMAALEAFLVELGERPFRARQLFRWLHHKRATSFDAMTDVGRTLRARLDERVAIARPVVESVRVADDGTRKVQLATADGHTIEAVYIPNASGPGKNALCISSQVGCAMGCTFCATAALKLLRHLSPGEIAGQLYAVEGELRASGVIVDDGSARPPGSVTNLIYMGMGEPLHNYAGVLGSIALLTHEHGAALSPRRLTVSTSGLVPAIERLGHDADVHIAISLNATTDEVRDRIMPVNRRFPIARLLAACRAFPLKARRRITFEYVLLRGINDSDDDARRLVRLLGELRCKVNLIPFNAHPLSPFGRPDDERVARFQDLLVRAGMSCFIRTTRGLDIDAACGMLGAKKLEEARRASPALPVL